MSTVHVWRRNGVDPRIWEDPAIPDHGPAADVIEYHPRGCTCGPRGRMTCRVVDVVATIRADITPEVEACMMSWLRGEQDGVR